MYVPMESFRCSTNKCTCPYDYDYEVDVMCKYLISNALNNAVIIREILKLFYDFRYPKIYIYHS